MRRRRAARYETSTVPGLRFVGMQLLLAMVVLHNRLVVHHLDWPSVGPYLVLADGYALLSWLTLRAFYGRFPRLLPLLFLSLDVFVFGGAVYVTGAHRSWLFPVVLTHVADQTATTFRRVLAFAHLAVLAYVLVLVAAQARLGAQPDWGIEIAKIALLWTMGVYTSFTARAAERLRARLVQTVRLSRDLVGQLERSALETQQALAASEVANRSKTEFLANMSHELRTPLNSVIGFADVLLKNRKQHLDGVELGYLARIRENGAHLLAIIGDILDLSRIEAGRLDVERTDVDLETLVPEVIGSLAGTGRATGVELTAEVPAGLATLHTDRTRMRQVLTNLVGNALKFTPAGSVRVRVLAEGAEPTAIEVVDTGIGIPPDRLPAIFRPFEQADNTTRRKYGGTGLGLSISRSICERLGYRLEAESQPGRGSTFRIVLRPAAD